MSEVNSSNCNHDCSSCHANCGDRQISKLAANKASKIKKVIAVVSGKGGVGKSTVTCLLAKDLVNKGYKVGILDADLTGPSIPRMYGITDPAYGEDDLILPATAENGVKIMSINMLLGDEEEPVIWRGPVLNGVLRQFFSDVKWGELDYLLVDMPPGTGDVPLTVFQQFPVDGTVIVTTPQELVSMIVMKAVNMAKMMNIPLVGVVENMSYVECPDCGSHIEIYGASSLPVLEERGLPVLDALPIVASTSARADMGRIYEADQTLPLAVAALEAL